MLVMIAMMREGEAVLGEAPDDSVGASRFTTTHAQTYPIPRSRLNYSEETEIKEFHFHTYFHLFETAKDCPKCNSSYMYVTT